MLYSSCCAARRPGAIGCCWCWRAVRRALRLAGDCLMLHTPRSLRGMVTAPHHLAAQAGLDILKDGGNAIEATVAVAATLAVVYPHMTGIGRRRLLAGPRARRPGLVDRRVRPCGPGGGPAALRRAGDDPVARPARRQHGCGRHFGLAGRACGGRRHAPTRAPPARRHPPCRSRRGRDRGRRGDRGGQGPPNCGSSPAPMPPSSSPRAGRSMKARRCASPGLPARWPRWPSRGWKASTPARWPNGSPPISPRSAARSPPPTSPRTGPSAPTRCPSRSRMPSSTIRPRRRRVWPRSSSWRCSIGWRRPSPKASPTSTGLVEATKQAFPLPRRTCRRSGMDDGRPAGPARRRARALDAMAAEIDPARAAPWPHPTAPGDTTLVRGRRR